MAVRRKITAEMIDIIASCSQLCCLMCPIVVCPLVLFAFAVIARVIIM